MADRPILRRGDELKYERVDAASGLHKAVLLDEGRNGSIRRFVLDAGATVPKHTNRVEHQQYVLEGEYVVGIGENEHRVEAGDSVLIPAGTVHWYRNDGDRPGTFLCAVPHGEDEIKLLE